jgi:hypothetical protein
MFAAELEKSDINILEILVGENEEQRYNAQYSTAK